MIIISLYFEILIHAQLQTTLSRWNPSLCACVRPLFCKNRLNV